MPIVNTWIKDEDYIKYLELRSTKGAWTEFIHNALTNPTDKVLTEKKLNGIVKTIEGEETPGETVRYKEITDKDINDISGKMDKQEKPDVIYPVVKPPKVIKTKEDAEAWVGPLSKQHSARKKSKRQ